MMYPSDRVNHHGNLKTLTYFMTISIGKEYTCSLAESSVSEYLTGCSQDVSQVCGHLKIQLGDDWFPSSFT